MNHFFNRLAAIVESSDDAILTQTPDGTITSWNSAATRIFGYDPDHAIGRHISMLYPPERLAEEADCRARIARGDRVDPFETQRVRKDGARVDVSISLSPVKDQQGQVVEVSTIARDITAQKRFDVQADAQAALFRVMADTAPVMIWMSGTDTLCSFFNTPWLDFTGRTKEQELGTGWADGVHPDDLQRCLDIYLGSFHARRPFRMEYRLRRADGQYRWIAHTGVPRYSPLAEFAGYIGSCIDITDLKRAETALASEIDTTRAFFEAAAEGIVIVNDTGHIVRVNARGAQMFGYAQEELVERPVEVLLPERFRAAHGGHRKNYFAAPRTRSMGLGLDLFGRRKDGREFPIEISLSSVKTAEGLLAMALVTDISERRSLERAARQHERLAALATLSAGIAHELSNPIGIISTRVELMLQDVESQRLPDELVEDLRVLYRNVQRVTRIAQGLLSFARLSPAELRPINVNAMIEETLLLVGKHLAQEGVQVSVTLDRTLSPIWGDGTALQQVMTNLLFNARDAMSFGGHVHIETAPEPDRVGWLRVTITDTGEGMRPETLKKIWEPFYTTKTGGTGLGLSVSHKIIREHGGDVEVQSEPGRGTTFIIRFPSLSSSVSADLFGDSPEQQPPSAP